MTLDTKLQINDKAIATFLDNARRNITNIDSASNMQKAGRAAIADARRSIFTSREATNVPGQFGRQFPPLKSGEQRRPMIKTGTMVNSFVASATKGSIIISNTRNYADRQNQLRPFFNEVRQHELIFASLQESIL